MYHFPKFELVDQETAWSLVVQNAGTMVVVADRLYSGARNKIKLMKIKIKHLIYIGRIVGQ